jgi:CheY-like chemotaxis protein
MPNSILVIDDSQTMRSQIIHTLRGADLFDRYFEAGDGLEGFKILADNRVDLVLCDLVMPNMDGFKFMSLVKAYEELEDIPLIMLTGRGDRELRLGVAAYPAAGVNSVDRLIVNGGRCPIPGEGGGEKPGRGHGHAGIGSGGRTPGNAAFYGSAPCRAGR